MKFTRILSFLLIGVMLMGMFSACGSDDPSVPKGYKLISKENIGYKLYVPTEWIVDMSTGVTTAVVSEKDSSNISFMSFEVDTSLIQATIGGARTEDTSVDASNTEISSTEAVTTEPLSTEAQTSGADDTTSADDGEAPTITTAEEYWEYYAPELKKTFPDIEYQKNGEKLLMAGKEALRYTYTATVTGEKYNFMQVVMLDKGTVYLLTYTARPENYEANLEIIEEIIGHIVLE